MSYRDNVSALAAIMGISNVPGLREEELTIGALIFWDDEGIPVKIEATNMNRGSRLFFQHYLGGDWDEVIIGERLLRIAEEYFAELWEENPEPGKRPLLDAFRSATVARAFMK